MDGTKVAKSCWRLLQAVLVVTIIILLIAPLIFMPKADGWQNVAVTGYQVLFKTSPLEGALAAQSLYPQGLMIIALSLLTMSFLLTLLPKRSFTPVFLILVSFAFVYLSVIQYTWIGKNIKYTLQWGYWLYIALIFLAALLNFVGSGLTRLKLRTGEFKSHVALLTMLVPGCIFLVIFAYLPMPGILLAFKNFKLYGLGIFENFFKSAWVGFNNFRFIFKTPDAYIMTRNTVMYNLIFIAVGLVASVSIAVGITEISNRKTAKVYQTMYFLPYFLSWVVVSYLVYALLNYDYGVVNGIYRSLGLKTIDWYMNPQYWMFFYIIANLWKYAGNGSIIYMATIVGMDSQLFEAAAIDGANRAKQIWHITLPMLKPTVILLTILNIGRIFYADFGMFYLLKRGSGPLKTISMVIDVYVYDSLSKGTINIGMVSAVGLYQSAVGFVLILLTNMIVRKISPDNTLM